MKPRHLAAATMALACLVAIFWLSTEREHSDVPPSAREPSPPTAATASLRDGTPEPSVIAGPYSAFSRASDASTALAALSALDAGQGHDVVEARLYLSGICRHADARGPVPGGDPWLEGRLVAYCGSYADPEVMAMTPDELMAFQARGTRAHIEAMLAAEEGQAGQAARVLEDVVLFSDSPWEVQAALAIASERGQGLDVLREALPGNDLANLRDVLALVAELQYCEMTRGCGGGTVAALRGCLFTGVCGPTVDYRSQLRQVYAPAVYADAVAVHEAILRARE